jgi:hypothetical protein
MLKSIKEMSDLGYGSRGTLQLWCNRHKHTVIDNRCAVQKTAGGGKWLIDVERYEKIQQSEC